MSGPEQDTYTLAVGYELHAALGVQDEGFEELDEAVTVRSVAVHPPMHSRLRKSIARVMKAPIDRHENCEDMELDENGMRSNYSATDCDEFIIGEEHELSEMPYGELLEYMRRLLVSKRCQVEIIHQPVTLRGPESVFAHIAEAA